MVPRATGDTEILDPARRDVVHPSMHPNRLTSSPRLLDRLGVTNVRHLTLDVFVHDAVKGIRRSSVGEVEGSDEVGERGEPAGEGCFRFRFRFRFRFSGRPGRNGFITCRRPTAVGVPGEDDCLKRCRDAHKEKQESATDRVRRRRR